MIGIDPRKYGFLENTCPEEGVVEVIEKEDLCKLSKKDVQEKFSDKNNFMTTNELAVSLRVDKATITRTVKKLGAVLHSVQTNSQGGYLLSEEQVLLVKQEIQRHHNLKSRQIDAVSSELEENQLIENAIMILHRRNTELQEKLKSSEAIIKRITDGKGCYTIKQTAKALKLPYGQIKLFQELRTRGILNNDNSPRQRHVDNGHFIVVVKYINEEIGNKPVTLTTGKGLVYLSMLLGTEIDKSVLPDYE